MGRRDDDNSRNPDSCAEVVKQHLLDDGGCLCQLSADEAFSRLIDDGTDAAAFPSVARLLLSVYRRQTDAKDARSRCVAIERATRTLVDDAACVDRLLTTALSDDDRYARYAAACAVSEAFGLVDRRSRSFLTDRLLLASAADEAGCHSAIEVYTRVLAVPDSAHKHHDEDDHHDDNDDYDDDFRVNRLACKAQLLAELRGDRWSKLVDAVVRYPAKPDGAAAVVGLARLWTAVLAACSDPAERDSYCADLPRFQRLLYAPNTEPHAWLNTVRLLGASLRWSPDDERRDRQRELVAAGRSAVARAIVSAVTGCRLLYFLHKTRNRLAGDADKSRAVLQDTVLLIVRSIRVFARGCDDNVRDDVRDAIERVMDALESYVRSSLLCAADMRLCQWLVRLLADRDDAVIECVLCHLDVAETAAPPSSRTRLDPFAGFAEFLACVSFEPDVLLDLLISDESEFLLCAVRVLKAACADDTGRFPSGCGDRLDATVAALVKLRSKVLRLHRKNMFPYDAGPIVRLIQRCDDLYGSGSISAS